MCLEDAVLCAEQHLVGERRWQQDEVAAGADGFWALLVLVLEVRVLLLAALSQRSAWAVVLKPRACAWRRRRAVAAPLCARRAWLSATRSHKHPALAAACSRLACTRCSGGRWP
jgi:hypothetical protein